MTKRLLSLAFAFIFALGIIPFSSVSASAKDDGYSVSNALKYAQKNWNNGVGLCADFASKCLQAGGVNVYSARVIDLYNQVKGNYGTAYKLKLSNGKSGRISMSANNGKLKKGDPIFYKCNYCGDFEHVVICNGANSEGYSQDYAHNKAHNGKKTTYTYKHCGGESWTLYSVRMYEGPRRYGQKTNVGIPEITFLTNGANGIVIKWSFVKGADKYNLYKKTETSSWQRVKVTTGRTFTDTTAKNGVKYTYTVRAVDGNKLSQYYAGRSLACLAAPKLSTVKNSETSVNLTWNKVSSADGYYVFRKGTAGSWKQIAKINDVNKVTYTDKTVNCSETYIYTVRAYDGKVKGCYNNNGIKTIFLKNPANLTVENSDLGLVISFDKIKAAKSYDIYRKTVNGDWEKISSLAAGNTTSFVDLNVENGETYCYTVKVMDGKYSSCFNQNGVECQYIESVVEEETNVLENTENIQNEEVVA